MNDRANSLHYGPLVSSGLLLGTGLGGFVDGIVFHQILQWHNMLSSTLPPTNLVDIKVNMVWDGLFHALTWVVTLVGLILLFRAGRRADVPWSGRALAGGMLTGWGLFNFVEGIIDHQILGIHHVHPGAGQLAWDLGFLASGVVLMAVGFALIRRDQHVAEPPRPGVLHAQRA
jgi:uncharacterized membrane protein